MFTSLVTLAGTPSDAAACIVILSSSLPSELSSEGSSESSSSVVSKEVLVLLEGYRERKKSVNGTNPRNDFCFRASSASRDAVGVVAPLAMGVVVPSASDRASRLIWDGLGV